MSLTPKQQRFVDEYLIDLNATQAAIRAGYSAKTADSQASRLLRNVKVSRAIGEAKTTRSERTKLDQDWVLNGLREVAERCMTAVPVMRFDFESKSMVQVIDDEGLGVWQFDSRGANRSLELVGKHLGMFTDASPGVNVNVNVNNHLKDIPDDELFQTRESALKNAFGVG